MRYFLIIVFSITGLATSAHAQWKKIADFGSGNTPILIFFLDTPQTPLIGFVSTVSGYWVNPSSSKLWRTTNGGTSWQETTVPLYKGNIPIASSLAFRNNMEGWFCEFSNDSTPIYHTIDGGSNWQPLSEQGAGALYFVPQTDRLIATSGSYLAYKYSLDGINFTSVYLGVNNKATVGVAFSDANSGIMTTAVVSPEPSFFLYTSDGGLTWNSSQQRGEMYSPIGIKGTKTFYAIAEADAYFTGQSGKLIRSFDGGITWQTIYQYYNPKAYSVTGSLQYNDHAIFFQTALDNSEGLMMSEDSGYIFYSICGPINYADTRFFVRDSFIYAGDKFGGLWLNTTGIGSNSKPILSDALFTFTTPVCGVEDKPVRFTLFDSCSGKQAKLLGANITGSPDFTIGSGGSPREIVTNDSLTIRYQPSSASASATVHLQFKLGWKVFDTSVTVIGKPILTPENILANFSFDTVILTTCEPETHEVRFTVKDTCLKQYASLDSISMSGSGAFWLWPTPTPRTTVENDSIYFLFTPLQFGINTSLAIFHFSFEGISFDTTITLVGVYQPSEQTLQPRIIPTQLNISSTSCDTGKSIFYYSLVDTCIHRFGTLESVTSTSPDFSVLGGFPQPTSALDSLEVLYTGTGNQTADLLLRFSIAGYTYDTVVHLTGKNTGIRDSLEFIPSLANNNIPSGQIAEYIVIPSKAVSGKNLSEIAFDVTLDADLVEPLEFTNYMHKSIIDTSSTWLANGFVTYHIRISGTDLEFDPTKEIVRIKLMTYVTDTVSTVIQLSNIRLNGFDPDYERCVLSASSRDTTFTLALLCGDKTIKDFLRHGRSALEITSIRPNPARDEVVVEFIAAQGKDADGTSALQIFDAAGKLVGEYPATKSPVTIPVSSFATGNYLLRLRAGDEVVSGSFVIER